MTLNNPKPTFQGQIILCLQPPSQINKACNFWYKFAIKGYIPLSDFYKISLGEGVPGLHHHAEFHLLWPEKKCGLTAPKIDKNCNFWYKFAPKGKSWVDRKTRI